MKTFNELMELEVDIWEVCGLEITNTYRVGNGTVAVNFGANITLFICGDDVGVSEGDGVRFSFFDDEELENWSGDHLLEGFVLQPVKLR